MPTAYCDLPVAVLASRLVPDMASQPALAGKCVVITRALEQSRELVEALERRGAQVMAMPLLAFEEPVEWSSFDEAVRSLSSFDWLVFTSANAVRFFATRCRALGIHVGSQEKASDLEQRLSVAAIGPTTARAARSEGFRVDWIASRPQGGVLADDLATRLHGEKVLLPRSDRAASELPVAMRAAGAEVSEVVAYRTVTGQGNSEAIELIRDGRVDVVAFASPSAVHHFVESLGKRVVAGLGGKVTFAAIGTTTAGAIRDAGFEASIVAELPEAEAFAAAMERHYRHSASQAKGK